MLVQRTLVTSKTSFLKRLRNGWVLVKRNAGSRSITGLVYFSFYCFFDLFLQDDNRYNAGRGAHLTLKRAEKARALVNKLPGMVDALVVKTVAWENERDVAFTYDGVRLLSMLEDYKILRQEKEEERKRQRDQKKLQGQLIAEQEVLFGSKPSPMKQQSAKKGGRLSIVGAGATSNRRLSLGGPGAHATPKHDLHSVRAAATPNTRTVKKIDRQLNNKDDGFGSLSTGRRGLDIAGVPGNKKKSLIEQEATFRKPFSPISSKEPSSKANTNELDRKHDMLPKTIQNNTTPFTTPSKTTTFTLEDENQTPQKNIIQSLLQPTTPFTPSAPMQTAMTPAVKEMAIPEKAIEYSFEERRAGFVLPRDHLKTVVTYV